MIHPTNGANYPTYLVQYVVFYKCIKKQHPWRGTGQWRNISNIFVRDCSDKSTCILCQNNTLLNNIWSTTQGNYVFHHSHLCVVISVLYNISGSYNPSPCPNRKGQCYSYRYFILLVWDNSVSANPSPCTVGFRVWNLFPLHIQVILLISE